MRTKRPSTHRPSMSVRSWFVVVVWYTFGSHHTVRPEDWPVMPVVKINFHLKPFRFFLKAKDPAKYEKIGHLIYEGV